MPAAANDDVRWRLTAENGLPLRCWDGDYVVYNRLSGDTHILDIVTGEALKTVMAGPVPKSEICRHVAEFLDVPNDSAVAERIDAILDALDRLGLIEPAAGC